MNHLLELSCEKLIENLFGKDYVFDDNLKGTPKRLAKMYREMLLPQNEINIELKKIFEKTFPTTSKSIIVSTNIKALSVCPHHLLPVEYNIAIGYQPKMKHKVIGASKLTRCARILAKQAILQEEYLLRLSDTIQHYLEPAGIGIMIIGKHGCMRNRGIKSNGSFCNSELRGSFLENSDIRAEFYKLIELAR